MTTDNEQILTVLNRQVTAMEEMNKTLTNHMTDYNKQIAIMATRVNMLILGVSIMGAGWGALTTGILLKFILE